MNYDKINEYYNSLHEKYDRDDSNVVGWSSKNFQYKLFEILLSIGYSEHDTILDLGCGCGHLIDYLTSKNISTKNYAGVDINPISIENCKQTYPKNQFIKGSWSDINHYFDYIVGSGLFHMYTNIDEVFKAIKTCLELCNKGVAFNFDNFNNKDRDDNLCQYYPDKMINLVSQNFPHNETRLIQNYHSPNCNFTIFIYK